MSSPTPLPITRAEAEARYAENWDEQDVVGLVDEAAELLGITFAPEPPAPPERKWPAKLELSDTGFAVLRDPKDASFRLGVACEGCDVEAAEEVRRRWNRCEELEHDIEEGWRRAAQIDRATIDDLRRNNSALLAELAERTRERDDNLEGLERFRASYIRCGQELDEAKAERDELRQRCEAVRVEIHRRWCHKGAVHGDLYRWECELEQALRGTRPVLGEEPTDA